MGMEMQSGMERLLPEKRIHHGDTESTEEKQKN
jgi:hypothetical protein